MVKVRNQKATIQSCTPLWVCLLLSCVLYWQSIHFALSIEDAYETQTQETSTRIVVASDSMPDSISTQNYEVSEINGRTLPHQSQKQKLNSVTVMFSSKKPLFNEREAAPSNRTKKSDRDYSTIMQPFSNRSTFAFAPNHFYSGFCNQLMAFSSFIMHIYDMAEAPSSKMGDNRPRRRQGVPQILLPSLQWKDNQFSTSRKQRQKAKTSFVPHERIFDVVQWNSHRDSAEEPSKSRKNRRHVNLPRLVVHDEHMIHYDGKRRRWRVSFPLNNATRPYAYGDQKQLFTYYKRYTKRLLLPPVHARSSPRLQKEDTSINTKASTGQNGNELRHPAELAMMLGALRPHPDLQRIIEDAKNAFLKVEERNVGYLCLHARIEPDMQAHRVCRDKKVVLLDEIIRDLYESFPNPPSSVHRVLIVLNRPLLERVASGGKAEGLEYDEAIVSTARANMDSLNRLRRFGMWNGTIVVEEAGSLFLPTNSYYAKNCPGLCGSIVNYHLALDSNIFVGSIVSTFATHVISTRLARQQQQKTGKDENRNYIYLPNGIVPVHQPPSFSC